MRRKHLILASCIISALLLTFTFHVSADENVEADAGASSNSAPLLDSYFWDNYIILPYIENTDYVYIDTGIKGSNNYTTSIQFSNIERSISDYGGIFGSNDTNPTSNRYYTQINYTNDQYILAIGAGGSTQEYNIPYYNVNKIVFDRDAVYLNNDLIHTFTNINFTSNNNIYLYAINSGGVTQAYAKYRLYSFSIYDHSLVDPNDEDSGEVGYLRYYYPAKSKSGDVIGLYDAVSKTFVTSSSPNSFVLPDGSDASMGITANIVTFIGAGLGWIGDIFEYVVTEPIILFFMAIGLCGVAFRWARRVYHF